MKYLVKPFRFILGIFIFLFKIFILFSLWILIFVWEFSFKSKHYKQAFEEVFDIFYNVETFSRDEYYLSFWDFVIGKKTIKYY